MKSIFGWLLNGLAVIFFVFIFLQVIGLLIHKIVGWAKFLSTGFGQILVISLVVMFVSIIIYHRITNHRN
jgi:hypothetical protein